MAALEADSWCSEIKFDLLALSRFRVAEQSPDLLFSVLWVRLSRAKVNDMARNSQLT
jgi:hypothetical protein